MIGITILGSTGSIGSSTLDVISRHPDRFTVIALTANTNSATLYKQCAQFRPRYAVLQDPHAANELRSKLKDISSSTQVLAGAPAISEVASLTEVDYVMAAIVGASGLLPTLAAVRAGKRVLLANKESLVMSGALFMQEVNKNGAILLPIDSEHNAIFQCLPPNCKPGQIPVGIRRLMLTASGGALREIPLSALTGITPEQACAHPNWNMGRKITVDSATMMNKGLEVIEAHWLFGLESAKIDTLLHPQSIVHSLVEYDDGSVLAQLGNPDMRIPIAHALAWPDRIESGGASLDLLVKNRLDFAPIDSNRFPCLALAYQCLTQGGTATTLLNAANEIAVTAFLSGTLAFTQIFTTIREVLDRLPIRAANNLEVILEDDALARECAKKLIRAMAR